MVNEGEGDGEHLPVLVDEAIDALRVKPDGVYVDGTFGRGGHSRRLLGRLGPGGRLLALDRDPEAVSVGRALAAVDDRFTMVHDRFSQVEAALDAQGLAGVDGLLLDLGVSSPQLDQAERGFSFQHDGPLDMRMDPSQGQPARQWLNEASENEIAEVLRDYGDERFAVPIAKAIVARRGEAGGEGIQSTRQLADLVAGVIRRRQKKPEVGKNPATRTFQAVRLHTNREIDELQGALSAALRRIAIGGRLAVISFHSIEDRIVKRFIAEHSGKTAARHPVTGAPLTAPLLRDVGRVLPGPDETTRNPRARSSVLRVAERLAGG